MCAQRGRDAPTHAHHARSHAYACVREHYACERAHRVRQPGQARTPVWTEQDQWLGWLGWDGMDHHSIDPFDRCLDRSANVRRRRLDILYHLACGGAHNMQQTIYNGSMQHATDDIQQQHATRSGLVHCSPRWTSRRRRACGGTGRRRSVTSTASLRRERALWRRSRNAQRGLAA